MTTEDLKQALEAACLAAEALRRYDIVVKLQDVLAALKGEPEC